MRSLTAFWQRQRQQIFVLKHGLPAVAALPIPSARYVLQLMDLLVTLPTSHASGASPQYPHKSRSESEHCVAVLHRQTKHLSQQYLYNTDQMTVLEALLNGML